MYPRTRVRKYGNGLGTVYTVQLNSVLAINQLTLILHSHLAGYVLPENDTLVAGDSMSQRQVFAIHRAEEGERPDQDLREHRAAEDDCTLGLYTTASRSSDN